MGQRTNIWPADPSLRPPAIRVWVAAARRHGLVALIALQALLLPMAPTVLSPQQARAWDNELARIPPMGWDGWNRFGCTTTETLIEEMADALVSSGMRDTGYEYIIIDDCWQLGRDPDGIILADPLRFPKGIRVVADYVHARGLKLGIYTDAGYYTCQGRPGSFGHERQDAETYASWGVDYLKIDWCYSEGLDPRIQYAMWHDVLAEVERPMVFSICNWGLDSPWTWGSSTGNLWRTTYDIEDRWESVLDIADLQVDLAAYARPGGWNDPDMLEVGNDGMTDTEYRVHFSMWAIMSAPLIAGNDLRDISATTRSILTNADVIAVDQDPAGIQGTRVHTTGNLEVWSKPLAEPGARAVLLLNRGEVPDNITVHWDQIGLGAGAASVRDLWAHADLGIFSKSFSATVPAHGGVMVKIIGKESPPPSYGEMDLSDLAWIFNLNGLGPAERNVNNGGQAVGDGGTLTLNGTTYAKGLGVHAASHVRYHLDRRCRTFLSVIGLDDYAGDHGSVGFQVWTDGIKLYDSGVMTGTTPTQKIHVNVVGREYLDLQVTDTGDDKGNDLADWAGARLVCWPPPTTIYLPLVWQD